MWVVEKVQPSHCSAGGPADVPHLEAGDQLGPTVEDVDQRNRPVGTDQLRGRIDLDHGQAASLRVQCITGAGVGLFLDAEFIDPRLPRRPISDLRHGTIARYRFQRASPSLWETAAELHVLAGRLCGSLFLGTLPAAGPSEKRESPKWPRALVRPGPLLDMIAADHRWSRVR
jgi:hypothetical protein